MDPVCVVTSATGAGFCNLIVLLIRVWSKKSYGVGKTYAKGQGGLHVYILSFPPKPNWRFGIEYKRIRCPLLVLTPCRTTYRYEPQDVGWGF